MAKWLFIVVNCSQRRLMTMMMEFHPPEPITATAGIGGSVHHWQRLYLQCIVECVVPAPVLYSCRNRLRSTIVACCLCIFVVLNLLLP